MNPRFEQHVQHTTIQLAQRGTNLDGNVRLMRPESSGLNIVVLHGGTLPDQSGAMHENAMVSFGPKFAHETANIVPIKETFTPVSGDRRAPKFDKPQWHGYILKRTLGFRQGAS